MPVHRHKQHDSTSRPIQGNRSSSPYSRRPNETEGDWYMRLKRDFESRQAARGTDSRIKRTSNGRRSSWQPLDVHGYRR